MSISGEIVLVGVAISLRFCAGKQPASGRHAGMEVFIRSSLRASPGTCRRVDLISAVCTSRA